MHCCTCARTSDMDKKDKDSSSPVGVLEDYFRSTDTDTDSSSKEVENSNIEDDQDAYTNLSSSGSGWRRGFIQLFRSKSKSSQMISTTNDVPPPPPRPQYSRLFRSKSKSCQNDHNTNYADDMWPAPPRLFRSKTKSSQMGNDVLLPPPLSILKLSRQSNSMRERSGRDEVMQDGFLDGRQTYHSKSSSRNFSLFELQRATKNFSPENFIGKGGYAEVYKGCLQDGQLVAVKRLIKGTTEEKILDFLSELGIMAHVDHTNTTKMIGYGVEGGLHLVLEYSHMGSLASLLQGFKDKLGWKVRYRIAVGTAEGLVYLHEGCQRRIIHRDIKAANILLTGSFEPQICDFGLAKWLPDKWTHHTVSKFEGTFGYLAPEYMMHGIVDEKTDVFAFGVVLLELITGRRALDCSQQSLVMWAKPLLKKQDIKQLIDPVLLNNYNSKQMYLMVLAASLCIQRSSNRRPTMSQVLQLLKGNRGIIESLKKHRKTPLWKRDQY